MTIHASKKRRVITARVKVPRARTTLERAKPWIGPDIGKLANRLTLPVLFDPKHPTVLVLCGHATQAEVEQLVGPVHATYTTRPRP